MRQMTSICKNLFSTLLLLIAATVLPHAVVHVDAGREMVVVDELIVPAADIGGLLSAVIDTRNSAAYFGTASYASGTAQVCKFNISSANSSFVFCINASFGVIGFASAIIDTQNSAAYFGSETIPGQVCKYNVSSANFSFVSCIAPPRAGYFFSAVIDTQNSVAYFGYALGVCKYNISSSNFSLDSCIEAPSVVNTFQSAVIDTQNSAAYFGTQNTGKVCKFNISPTNFSFVSCIAAPLAVSFLSAVIDTQNSGAYFSAYARVCKFNVSSTNFSFVSCIAAPSLAFYFRSAVIDTQNSAAYFGTASNPGQVCKFNISSTNFSFGSCIAAPPGAINFRSAVIDTQNSAAYFGTASGRVVKLELNAFGCDSNGQLSIGQDDFSQSNVVNFVAIHECNVTISSVTVEHPIKFLQRISNSIITLQNITSVSPYSFVHLTSSTPFLSSSSLIFENNQFTGTHQLVSSPSNVDLSHSSWIFKCNRWVNGYNNAFKEFASRHAIYEFILHCRSSTVSQSSTHNQSESASLIESETDSSSVSHSESLSSSVTFSDTIYCTNLDEITCNNTPSHQCKFCPTTNICVELDQRCDSCDVFNEQFCPLTKGRCKYCSEHQVCVNATTTPTCDCVSFSSSACAVANSTCNYCPSESVCVPSQQFCGCINFTSTISLNNSDAFCVASPACHFCPEQQTCLPQAKPCTCHDMNQEQCDVSVLSSQTENSCKYCSNISVCAPKNIDCLCMALPVKGACDVASGCHWCANYSTCAPTHAWPDCDCASLRTSDFCDILSNSKCEWCEKENMCADPDTYKCECERFTKSMCMTSNCTWCDNMNTCTVEENKNCECYYLRTEERCSSFNSNDKCSWCNSSSQPQSRDGSYTFSTPINDFNYCIDSATDRCECSYLSPAFCEFATLSPPTSSSTTPNFSTSCKFCPNLQLCTHPDNRECECGDEYSVQGCERSPVCSFRQPVLTIEEAVPYCGNNFGRLNNAAAGCDPVTCEGILDGASCNASGCDHDAAADRCETTKCFNFFVRGFSPQPFILYFFGLFKDAAVVLLLGAIGDLLTRPIMDIVTKAKGKWKKWTHILPQVSTETLYMSDAVARDGYTFSFSKYVERIQRDTFVFVDDDGETQVLDEQYRLKLFDMTAFCLFDNMLWVKPSDDDEEEEEEEEDEDDKEKQDGEKCDAIVTDHHQEQEMKTFSSEKREEEVAVQEEAREESQKPDEGKNRANDDGNNKITNNDDDDDDIDENQASFSPRDSKESTPEEQNTDEDKEERKKQATLSPRESKVPTPELDKAKQKKIINISDDSENETTTPRRSRSATPQPSQPSAAAATAAEAATSTAAPATRHRRRHEPVRLKASDFDSLVSLCDTVATALIERASKNIYYAQSRSAVVSACSAINSFPSVIQLAYYTIAVGALYVFSMIAVLGTKNIDRMVAGCDAGLNRTEVGNQTAIASNAEHDYLSSTFVTGAFLLLGFRLMNASAQATSALIFVKTIRGLYQRYSGLYDLTLQQRIPLMVLYANRPVQIVLIIYAIFILPFALAGPLYGGIFVDARCLVPIAIGAAILFIDFLVLSVARWISRRNIVIHDREKLQNLLDFSNSHDDTNGEQAGNDDAGLLDNNGTNNSITLLLDRQTRTASSTTKEKEGGSNLMHDDDDDAMFEDFVVVKDDEDLLSGTTHTKFTLQLPSSHQRNLEGESNYDDNKSGLKPLDKHVAAQTSVTSSAPVTLGKAIIVFMLTEEIPVLALSLALQVSMNYLCLLKFSYAFGIRDDPGRVYQTDYDGRTLECVWDSLTADANNAWEKISTVLSALSSFVPFM